MLKTAVFVVVFIAPLLKMSAWLLHFIGVNVPPAARDSSEVARTLNLRCYPHTENGRHS